MTKFDKYAANPKSYPGAAEARRWLHLGAAPAGNVKIEAADPPEKISHRVPHIFNPPGWATL